jgi:hypothetical protein
MDEFIKMNHFYDTVSIYIYIYIYIYDQCGGAHDSPAVECSGSITPNMNSGHYGFYVSCS